jgi:hypothetical protein
MTGREDRVSERIEGGAVGSEDGMTFRYAVVATGVDVKS